MIRVEGLTFRYPTADSNALAGLDFEVASGEIFGFLGPNGAGKSTTQKILIGLLRGFAGSVSLLGRPLEAWGPDLYEHIGVAFELPNHYLKLSGRENLEYFRALYSDGTVSPDALLERVGLAADAATPVGRYSKGMKTRLGIARALLNDPDLLFLDEPTTGLDPVGAQQIKQLLGELRQRGKTLFLTTHDMAVADQLCDRVAFLVDGTIRVLDAPRTLRLRHGSRRVRVESGASDGEGSEAVEFPLEGLGENREFLELLRGRDVQTIHTLEASLEHVFIDLTGRRLR